MNTILDGNFPQEALVVPIKFNPKGDGIRAVFTHSKRAQEYWSNRLIEMGFSQSQINKLFIGQGGTLNFLKPDLNDDGWKMMILLLLDYKRTCDEFQRMLNDYLKTLSKNADEILWNHSAQGSQIIHLGNGKWEFKFLDGSTRDVILGWNPIRPCGSIDNYVSPNIIPGNNHWFRGLINELEKEAINILLNIPESEEPIKWIRWFFSNWFFR